MIAVDTSAIVAAALREPDAERYLAPLLLSECTIGWPTLIEAHMVLRGYGTRGLDFLSDWASRPNVTSVDFGRAQHRAAASAFDRYGKGRHPAKLNMGDCMSYAVAETEQLPLLYKGADFALTDIRPALP